MIGKTIQGYEILEVRDSGAMGIVYKAKDPNLPRVVAIKVMNRGLADDPVFLERFRMEASALALVQSPNIVTIHRLIDTAEDFAIVMEFIDGRSLQELAESEDLTWQRTTRLIRQVLAGLGRAHEAGVIHRDIKPSNVLVLKDDTVKIVDFGLAKSEQLGRNLTQTGTSAGTLYYMSPEQIHGFRSVGPRSDLYSVGMTFYKLVCGRLPFETTGSNYDILKEIVEGDFLQADEVNPLLPASLARFLARSIEKKPDDRFSSAAAMIDALDAILAGSPVPSDVWARRDAMSGDGLAQSPSQRVRTEPEPDRDSSGTTAVSRSPDPPRTDPHASERPAPDVRRNRAGLYLGGIAVVALLIIAATQLRSSFWGTTKAADAMLDITTTPPGAEIYLDDIGIGQTPIDGRSQSSGRVNLTTKLAGYAPRDSLLQLEPGRQYQIAWRLSPEPPEAVIPTEETTNAPATRLAVTVVPWGQVFLNGTQTGKDRVESQTFDVEPGPVRVRVRHPEYGTWEKSVQVAHGQSTPIRVDFTRLIPVVITSQTEDGRYVMGEIVVDGRTTGSSTPKEIKLRVGSHSIEVRQTGHECDPVRLNLFGPLEDPIKVVLRKQ